MDNDTTILLFSKRAKDSAISRLKDIDFFEETDFADDCDQLDFRDQIASGSYGRVYTALVGTNVYAVKVEDFHDGDEEQANLLVELSILQSLPHERLVKFIIAGCHQVEGSPLDYKIMIVMELCKNGALREVLKRKISWSLKVRLALDISQGIEFLHDNGIIHRDIKTTNILVDDKWRAKLCDFSFAIHKDSQSKRDYTYGTEEFMSPEIAFALDFDLSADIFSFGILLCELMTDIEPSIRKPQDSFALNEEEVRSRILPGCPEALEALAFQCCESDPLKRPTISTCIEELETIFAQLRGVKPSDLPTDNNILLRPEVIQSTNSPEREGRVQSTRNISIENQQKEIILTDNTHIKELEAEIHELRQESKKMNKELHALTVISANRDRLFSNLLSKIKGIVTTNIDIDELKELKDIETGIIIDRLESNFHSMETELNDIQEYSTKAHNEEHNEEIFARLNTLEESIKELKIKISVSSNQSEKRIAAAPIKPIEIDKDKGYEGNDDLMIDLVDFPPSINNKVSNVNDIIELNTGDPTVPESIKTTKEIIIDEDDKTVAKLKEFPIPINDDKQPTAELSKALGSFLSIIGKCSENNNRTRELMSNLDRITDAKLSYNTPNKFKVIAANNGNVNTPKQASTLKDFTWREIETPSINSLRSPRAESSLIQDTISKRLKTVSPTYHFQGRFSPRISSSSSIGKNSISSMLKSAETEIESKAAVSKFFEPPPSLIKISPRIDSVSTLDRSLKEKPDYNRRSVQPPANKNPVLERFSPEKTNAMKYQELLEQKYT